MASVPSSSEGPSPMLGMNKGPSQLKVAQPSRSPSKAPVPRESHSPARGRNRTRSFQSRNRRSQGSLLSSRPPIDKGKGQASTVDPHSSSPAANHSRKNVAPKVFVTMPQRGAQQRSWAAVAKSASKGYSLSFIPPELVGNKKQVNITAEMLECSDPKWEECLVGYLIGKKLPFKLVETALKYAWGTKLADMMANDDGFYFFHIPDRDCRKDILEGGPLTVAKVPLVLQQWHPLVDLEKKKQETVPIWIRLRNIPYSLWSAVGISAIASAVGKPLYVDSQTERMRMISYARVCVEIQAGADLPEIVEVALLSEVRTVKVEYEWRPSFCPTCISFGHKCQPPIQRTTVAKPSVQRTAAVSTGSDQQDLNAMPGNSAPDPDQWIEVPTRRRSSTKAQGSSPLPATRTEEATVQNQNPPTVSRPPEVVAPVLVSSPISEDTNPQVECAQDSTDDEDPSMVHSSMPEADCPPAPLRENRRSGRSTPQVLGLPSSTLPDVLKPGDTSLNLRCTRSRK